MPHEIKPVRKTTAQFQRQKQIPGKDDLSSRFYNKLLQQQTDVPLILFLTNTSERDMHLDGGFKAHVVVALADALALLWWRKWWINSQSRGVSQVGTHSTVRRGLARSWNDIILNTQPGRIEWRGLRKQEGRSAMGRRLRSKHRKNIGTNFAVPCTITARDLPPKS